MTRHILGFDIGGTGVRGALARLAADGAETLATHADPAPVRMGADGVDPAGVIQAVRRTAARLLTADIRAEAVLLGCTGAALLGDGLRQSLADALTDIASTVILCSDVLTSHIGALGLHGGTVLAAGTGAVALGFDGRGNWRRADGWGVLLGDCGGGAWIGRAGIDAALRCVDGRPDGSPPLLAALSARFGSPADLVHAVSSRPDRGAVMASFAPDVAAAAAADDDAAQRILRTAGSHLADTLLAAAPPGAPPRAAAVGNLLRAGGFLTDALADRLTQRAPEIRLVNRAGTALDGAITLAAAVIGQAPPAGADIEVLATTH